MAAVRAGVQAIPQVVDINVACSFGILTRAQANKLAVVRRDRGDGGIARAAAELEPQLGDLGPDEVPLNFLDPRPGTPFAARALLDTREAQLAIAAFRLASPAR